MSHNPERPIAFIGGGNMASAILGGLLRRGHPASALVVVEPWDEQRARLQSQWGLQALPEPGPALLGCDMVVWAVKPQVFKDAAQAAAAHTRDALHLSVAAGIRSDSIAHWLGTERVVRAMPNTPALVGQGMSGLYARAAVGPSECATVESVMSTTGAFLWVPREVDLDAVTALSGSGPAYVFYFIEAMREAGAALGLDADTATRLAIGTFRGASALAGESTETPEVLRQRVTSKGGTTHAAITSMEASGVKEAFIRAMQAAHRRAAELGDEFGG